MKKKILILGGTQMIGRDFVEYCLENKKDYEIYLANRNETNPDLFSCNQIYIDRNSKEKCEGLLNENFDIVVDFSCYNLSQLTNVLSNIKYEKYYMISTLAVLDTIALNDKTDPYHEYATGKLDLENYINSNLKDKICIVRPCVIYGENDYTQRFYKKEKNFYDTNNTLVCNNSHYIYLRDFTIKLLRIIEDESIGTITVTGDNFYKIHPQESKYIEKKVFEHPFKHIVIDNLFNKKNYNKICSIFSYLINKGERLAGYEAFIAELSRKQLKGGLEFFASKCLQKFINKEFNIETNNFVATSSHFHLAPSKSGDPHKDLNIVSFDNKTEEDLICSGDCFARYDNDVKDFDKKVMRSVALLYYLNNEDGIDSFGGGTGIFDGYDGNLIKTIEPKNNRLFIFEITPNSYHSFLGANFPRSCIVTWFHSSPAYMSHRHGFGSEIENWPKEEEEEYWDIKEDPEYPLYFNRKLIEKYESMLKTNYPEK